MIIYQKQYLIDIAFYQILVESFMSKPESIKIDPWTDFPRQPYTLFTDDFVHQKLYTLKVNSKSDRSTVNVKANISADKGGPVVSDQIKFWFPVNGTRSVYARVKSNNYLKLHYDNGVFQQWNSRWNLYTSINTNKSLENISLRLGAANNSQRCHSDNRLRVDFGADSQKNLTWYNRTVVTKDKFTFGLLAAYGITHNVLVKNNLLFGYKIDDNSTASLRLENNGYRKDIFDWSNFRGYFDYVKVDFVSKYQNNIEYGLQGTFNVNGKAAPFEEALLVVKHNNAERSQCTKLRVSSKFNFSFSFKCPSLVFKNIATTTYGIHGSNLLNEKRVFKFGAQLQFNV